jgi:hypothetical protein
VTAAEIDCISDWDGSGPKGSFVDQGIIDEYGLDVESGENTWPRFAAVLRSRKETWAIANPALARRRSGLEDLETAIERCAIAGVFHDEIVSRAKDLCEEICS